MNISFRYIEYNDYNKNYIQLLSQLTICENIKFGNFCNFIDDLNENHLILVCEIDNKIVASGTLLIEQKIIRNFGKVGHIEDIVVDNKYNGHGIGKKLLEELKKYAKNNNCYKVILDCRDEVINFYEKCGFSKKEFEMVLYF